MDTRFQIDNSQNTPERVLLIAVEFPNTKDFPAVLSEAKELVHAAGGNLITTLTCKREKPHNALFIGTGKIAEYKQIIDENNIQLVIFNHALTPSQERNIEQSLQCRVLDRIGLILSIFAMRAQSSEGKLQVELAQLEHLSSRLVRAYGHLKSQRGGIGLKGPGETQLETDRRLIAQKIVRIKKRLQEVKNTRTIQRKNRSKLINFTLVGYTNVGKSTIFNALTKSNVIAKDQLFATLDTTARKLWLNENLSIILMDTVGFVRDLPHKLIVAFSATLEEVKNADILLHVIDASDIHAQEHTENVNQVLQEIGAGEIPQILVYNKIDCTDNKFAEIQKDNLSNIKAIRISANDRESLRLLYEIIEETAQKLNKN